MQAKLITQIGIVLALGALLGCKETPSPSATPLPDQVEAPPAPLTVEDETPAVPPAAERPRAVDEEVAEERPRKSVLQSLYQAVRNGAAEAMSEESSSP